MTEALPAFPYHPDPIATEAVKPSDVTCVCCGRARGYVYTGAPYGPRAYDDCLCPWCIADGSAADKLGASFNDVETGPDDVPDEVILEIAERTPGIDCWQTERWQFHCGDGAAYLGSVGRAELEAYPDALEMLRHENDEFGWSAKDTEEYLEVLDKYGSPSAYLFRCRHCGVHMAFSDFM